MHKAVKSVLHHGVQIKLLWPVTICFQLILLPQNWVLLSYSFIVLLEDGKEISLILLFQPYLSVWMSWVGGLNFFVVFIPFAYN